MIYMVEFETDSGGYSSGWILDPEMASYIWDSLIGSDSIIPTRDPPFLYDINMGFFDNPPNDGMNWWHLTRVPDNIYREYESWDKMPARWNPEMVKRHKVQHVFNNNELDEAKIVIQWYTYHGAMLTIELEDIGEGWLDIFIRIPVHMNFSDTSKELYEDNPMLEYFENRVRQFRPERFDEMPIADNYFHAHYSGNDTDLSAHSKEYLKDAVDNIIDIIERSTERW